MTLKEIEGRKKKEGIRFVIGVDESGRGCLAGPICAAAVLFDIDTIESIEVRDSKCMTGNARLRVYKKILSKANDFSIIVIPSQQIDKKGIQAANIEAIKKSVLRILERNVLQDYVVLVDHYSIPGTNWESITYGDSLSIAIASASIVAKVTRDMLMSEMAVFMPQYSFQLHKGYGTEQHLLEIDREGTTAVHRMSFSRNAQKRLFNISSNDLRCF